MSAAAALTKIRPFVERGRRWLAVGPFILSPSIKSAGSFAGLHRWAMPVTCADYSTPFSHLYGFLLWASRLVWGTKQMRTSTESELREIVWLASVVGALSILGTGLAVALALVLVAA